MNEFPSCEPIFQLELLWQAGEYARVLRESGIWTEIWEKTMHDGTEEYEIAVEKGREAEAWQVMYDYWDKENEGDVRHYTDVQDV